MGPFYKKIRCDKFGYLSISTKTALNNQIQSSWETNRYIYTVAQIPPQKIVVFTKCKSQFEIIPTGVYILLFISIFILIKKCHF